MSSIRLSHPRQLARPHGWTARARPLHHPRYNIMSLSQHDYRPGVRSFHIAPTVLAITQAAQDTIIAVHNVTHMPWFLTIPLLSVGVTAVFRLPLNLYVHQIHQRQSKLTPILQAWSSRLSRDVFKERVPPARQQKEVEKRYLKTQSRIFRTLGLQRWKAYISFLGLPFWLFGIDAVRQLCGGPRGVIGSLISRPVGAAPEASSNQGAAYGADTATDTVTAAADHVSTFDASTASAMADHAGHLPDPSIAFEGCLWFPDLTVPDPYHILPYALSAVMVANMLPTKAVAKQVLFLEERKDEPESSKAVSTTSDRSLRFRRVLVLLVAAIGPLTADLPAAIHLYWICTSVSNSIAGWALSRFMPIENESIKRCTDMEPSMIRPRPSEKPTSQPGPQERTTK
ncbi:hypothetical protein GGR52DRAFT_2096 [Hypoxylon sp. FL1284]|nr:hypothetical protein GGR52DRAFT_2096 [Hypoxylon sp. FL1284]